MPADHSWQISAPQELTLDGPVEELRVRLVGGAVNVVGVGDSADAGSGARIEVSSVEGPALSVRQEGTRLVVGYDDEPQQGFLAWLRGRLDDRSAVVSVRVPAGARVSVGVVGASAVVSGLSGRADVRGVSGDLTLVRLSGAVAADTVSGTTEALSLTGDLRFHSVSGDLTVLDGGGGGGRVSGETVSGDLTLDLEALAAGADLRLTTVSGEVAVRLPRSADARVDASTTTGPVHSGFEELRVDGQFGAKRLTGTLGSGGGRLRATTVTGAIALLERPPGEDDAPDAAPSFTKGL